MYNNKLDEFSAWSMVLTTEQMIRGIRGILDAARSDSTIKAEDVAHELFLMLARDNSNPQPLDVSVCRDIEDWLVPHWRDDSAQLIDTMASLVLTCGMTRGLALLEKAAESSNDEVRAIAQDALAEAARDTLKGWTPRT
jgi:hypothetical protein